MVKLNFFSAFPLKQIILRPIQLRSLTIHNIMAHIVYCETRVKLSGTNLQIYDKDKCKHILSTFKNKSTHDTDTFLFESNGINTCSFLVGKSYIINAYAHTVAQ